MPSRLLHVSDHIQLCNLLLNCVPRCFWRTKVIRWNQCSAAGWRGWGQRYMTFCTIGDSQQQGCVWSLFKAKSPQKIVMICGWISPSVNKESHKECGKTWYSQVLDSCQFNLGFSSENVARHKSNAVFFFYLYIDIKLFKALSISKPWKSGLCVLKAHIMSQVCGCKC